MNGASVLKAWANWSQVVEALRHYRNDAKRDMTKERTHEVAANKMWQYPTCFWSIKLATDIGGLNSFLHVPQAESHCSNLLVLESKLFPFLIRLRNLLSIWKPESIELWHFPYRNDCLAIYDCS
jgi:hypothetical protein